MRDDRSRAWMITAFLIVVSALVVVLLALAIFDPH